MYKGTRIQIDAWVRAELRNGRRVWQVRLMARAGPNTRTPHETDTSRGVDLDLQPMHALKCTSTYLPTSPGRLTV